jgi:glycyl-tRNA synthetase alpha subunit
MYWILRHLYNKFTKSLDWKSYVNDDDDDPEDFEMWMEVVGVGRFLIEGQVGNLATPKHKTDDFYGVRGIILEDDNYILRVMFENTEGRTIKYHEANLHVMDYDKVQNTQYNFDNTEEIENDE